MTLFATRVEQLQAVPAAASAKPAEAPSAEAAPLRLAALAKVRAERARWRLGDLREADNPCPACKRERLERLECVEVGSGQTWSLVCTTAGCVRARWYAEQHALGALNRRR